MLINRLSAINRPIPRPQHDAKAHQKTPNKARNRAICAIVAQMRTHFTANISHMQVAYRLGFTR